MNKNTKIIFGTLMFVGLLLISFYFIVKSYDYVATSFKVNKITRDVDYKVYLEKNNFYESEFLGKDRAYVSSLINYFELYYIYSDKFPGKTDFDYNYNIKGILKIYNSDGKDKLLYTKDYNLVEKKEKSFGHSDSFDIEENVKIDYKNYKKVVEDFKKTYGLSIIGELEVVFCVNMNSSEFHSSENSTVIIPLTSSIVNVTTTYDNVKIQKIEEKGYFALSNVFTLVVGIFFLVGALVSLGYVVKKIILAIKETSKYSKELSKILKQYDRLIVETDTVIDISSYEVIETKTFNELLDVRDNLEKPILHKELEKDKKSLFMVIADNDVVYKYILEEEDEELDVL